MLAIATPERVGVKEREPQAVGLGQRQVAEVAAKPAVPPIGAQLGAVRFDWRRCVAEIDR